MIKPSENMRVRPARGRLVRFAPNDPRAGRPIPEGGARVPCISYYLRRLYAGDLVEVAEAPAEEPEAEVQAQETAKPARRKGRKRSKAREG